MALEGDHGLEKQKDAEVAAMLEYGKEELSVLTNMLCSQNFAMLRSPILLQKIVAMYCKVK